MIEDAQGHRLSGATAAAAATYDRAVRAFNLVHGDSVGLFDTAREAAPDFAMATLGKAWVFAIANDPGLMTKAAALVETARGLSLNEREQAHLAALSQVVQGARAAAVAVLEPHLMQYPFDIVAHQAAALSDGFLGRFHRIRDRSARALPLWPKDMPGYGSLLAFHAFGAEEAGDYARAEDESREAAELEPLSFWPHHTVAHVMEMTGRPEDGLGWMSAREALWSMPEHMNQVHIWWHKALFHVELGQYEAALGVVQQRELRDRSVRFGDQSSEQRDEMPGHALDRGGVEEVGAVLPDGVESTPLLVEVKAEVEFRAPLVNL